SLPLGDAPEKSSALPPIQKTQNSKSKQREHFIERMLRCKSATKKLLRDGCRHPVSGLRPMRALLVMKRPGECPFDRRTIQTPPAQALAHSPVPRVPARRSAQGASPRLGTKAALQRRA